MTATGRRYLSVRAGTYPAAIRRSVPVPREPAEQRIALDPIMPKLVLPELGPEANPPGVGTFSDAEPLTPTRPLRVLLGTVLGGILGLGVGYVLLAFSSPEPLILMRDPATLWQTVDDTWVRLSASVVAAGFALLGAFLARPRR
jgi:hypothetical protein